MAAPRLDVDREAVKTLVRAIGVRPAAREMGLSEDTVLAWSNREGWLEGVKPVIPLPKSMQRVNAINAIGEPVKSPSDAMSAALEDLSSRSRIGFAKASCKVAEKMADQSADELVAQSTDALTWAKTAALAHGWQAAGTNQVNVAVALRIDME